MPEQQGRENNTKRLIQNIGENEFLNTVSEDCFYASFQKIPKTTVTPKLYPWTMLLTEVVLLDNVERAELGRVSEEDEHDSVDDDGGVTDDGDWSTRRDVTPRLEARRDLRCRRVASRLRVVAQVVRRSLRPNLTLICKHIYV